MALLGNTLSYTFIVNKGVANINKLINKETTITCLYIPLFLNNVPQNHSFGFATTTSFSILLLKLYSGLIIITSPIYSF